MEQNLQFEVLLLDEKQAANLLLSYEELSKVHGDNMRVLHFHSQPQAQHTTFAYDGKLYYVEHFHEFTSENDDMISGTAPRTILVARVSP